MWLRRNPFELLPDKFRTDLYNARIAGIGDVSEAAAADVPVRIHELRMVKYVEEFTANLQGFCFSYRDSLCYSEIGVVDSRAMKEPAVRRSETSTIRTNQN